MNTQKYSLMEESIHQDAVLGQIDLVLNEIINAIESGKINEIDNQVIDQSIEELQEYLTSEFNLNTELNAKIRYITRLLSNLQQIQELNKKPSVQIPYAQTFLLLIASLASLCYIVTNTNSPQVYAIANRVREVATILGFSQSLNLELVANEIYSYIIEHNLNESSWFKDTNSFFHTSVTQDGEVSIQFPLSISTDLYFRGIDLPIGNYQGNESQNMYYVLNIAPNMPIEMLEAQLQSLAIEYNLIGAGNELLIYIPYPQDQNILLARLILEDGKIKGITSQGFGGTLSLRFGDLIDVQQFSGARG